MGLPSPRIQEFVHKEIITDTAEFDEFSKTAMYCPRDDELDTVELFVYELMLFFKKIRFAKKK